MFCFSNMGRKFVIIYRCDVVMVLVFFVLVYLFVFFISDCINILRVLVIE